MKKVSNARIREAWLDASISGEEAARRVGLTRVNLWIRAKGLGLPARREGPPILMPEAEFAAMWQAGVARSEIAAHFGVSLSTPRQTARRLGLPPRPLGKRPISMGEFHELQLAAALAQSASETRAEIVARRKALRHEVPE